jgi:hypothetical protein
MMGEIDFVSPNLSPVVFKNLHGGRGSVHSRIGTDRSFRSVWEDFPYYISALILDPEYIILFLSRLDPASGMCGTIRVEGDKLVFEFSGSA